MPTDDPRVVPIAEIAVGERFRRDLGDLRALSRSIAEIGLLHPVVVTPDQQLIAGQRRLEACRALGWTDISVHIVDLADVVRGQRDENVERKDFLPTEMVAVRRALEPAEREAARERIAAAGASAAPHRPAEKAVETFHSFEGGKTRDKVAAYIGVSGRTLDKAAAVVEAAEREPEKYAPLVEKMDATGKVNGVFKQMQRLEQAAQIAAEPPPLPTGPFRVIVADPPWPYASRAEDVTHRASNPYPSMTIDEIKALPVRELADQNAILWLWTTNAHLPEAFAVVRAWGFEHKTVLTWVKDRMGTGDWLRGQTEHCIMAVRGKPVVTLTNQTTVIHGPLREHSRKPDEFYALVEGLCPGSKLELFSRQQRDGWTAHGNAIPSPA